MWRWRIIVAAAAALAAAIGCGSKQKAADKEIVRVPLEFGGRPDALAAWAVKAQVKGIKPYLKSEKNPERITAINALGCLKGNAEATQLLLEIAHGSDARDAGFAILGLAHQGAPEAKAEIERAFASPEASLRRDACMAIGEYGDKSLYPLLEKASVDDDVIVRNGAAIAAKRLETGK